MTWNYKIKLIQALCYIGGPLVLIFNFNAWYLFYAWLAHWLIVHIGISIGLHRCFAHNSWVPKNKVILLMLHFLTVINGVGSTITWTGIHRKHHAYSETVNDPHCPVDKSFWTKVAYWFNYWKPHKVNVKFVRDLINDPYHKFFHNNYFKVLISYMALLAVIDLDLFSNPRTWSKIAEFNQVAQQNFSDLYYFLELVRRAETSNQAFIKLKRVARFEDWAKFLDGFGLS